MEYRQEGRKRLYIFSTNTIFFWIFSIWLNPQMCNPGERKGWVWPLSSDNMSTVLKLWKALICSRGEKHHPRTSKSNTRMSEGSESTQHSFPGGTVHNTLLRRELLELLLEPSTAVLSALLSLQTGPCHLVWGFSFYCSSLLFIYSHRHMSFSRPQWEDTVKINASLLHNCQLQECKLELPNSWEMNMAFFCGSFLHVNMYTLLIFFSKQDRVNFSCLSV